MLAPNTDSHRMTLQVFTHAACLGMGRASPEALMKFPE